MFKKAISISLSLVLIISFFCGCNDQSVKNDSLGGIASSQESIEDDKTKYSGMLSYASLTEDEENDRLKRFGWNVVVKFYDNLNSMLLAMESGQIEYISVLPKSTAEYIKKRNSNIVIRKSSMAESDRIRYSMATLEGNTEVYNILNDAIKEIINDGTIKDIETNYIDKFVDGTEDPKEIEMPRFKGAKTIKVAVTGDLPPFDFVSAGGKPSGYNSALLSEIANRAKVNIKLVTMDEKAKVTALATKNIDVIFWLSSIKYGDDKEMFSDCPNGVVMTDCYYEDDVYFIYPMSGRIHRLFDAM